MPLLKGKANIGRNIEELSREATRPRSNKQAVAIALHAALDSNKSSKGGKLKKALMNSGKKGY